MPGAPPLGSEYRKLWTASAASNLSDGVGLVAAPLLAASLTRDPALVAGAAFAQRLPWLLFPLFTGALLDRVDRKRAMGAANLLRAALVGALGLAVLAEWASLPLLYAVFFLLGAIETLYDNAAQAMVPAIVERRQLERANGRLYAIELVNNLFAGRPVGGFLFGVAAAFPFLLGSGAFAASAAMILALRGGFRPEKPVGEPRKTMLAEIGEGIGWLYRHRLLLALAAMVGVMNMMNMAADAILVLFAQENLGLGSFGFGLLVSAAAVGGLAGSFLSDKIIALTGAGKALVGCVMLNAVSYAGIAMTGNPFVAGSMFAVSGLTAVTWNVITVSLRQAMIPEELFGRVNSVYRLLAWGGMSVGALLGGLLAEAFGLRAPFWAAAAVIAALGLLALPLARDPRLAARG